MKPRTLNVLPADTEDLPLASVADVIAALAVTFNQVRRGELDARITNCLGMLAGTLLRAIQGEREILMTVQPAPLAAPQLTDELKQCLLAEVRERQAARQVLEMRELPAPHGSERNGENVDPAPGR